MIDYDRMDRELAGELSRLSKGGERIYEFNTYNEPGNRTRMDITFSKEKKKPIKFKQKHYPLNNNKLYYPLLALMMMTPLIAIWVI